LENAGVRPGEVAWKGERKDMPEVKRSMCQKTWELKTKGEESEVGGKEIISASM